MDIPTTHTWVDGETPDADLMNDHVGRAVNLVISPPAASVRRAAAQSIAYNTYTAIQWDAEDEDTDAMFGSPNFTRFTANTAGLYLLTGSVAWAGNSTGYRAARWSLNGSVILYQVRDYPGHANAYGFAAPTVLARAVVGDYFELGVQQTSGGSLNISPASPDCCQAAVLWVAS